MKIILGTMVLFGEEFLFYVTLLSNMMTKRSLYMWLTFILGRLL